MFLFTTDSSYILFPLHLFLVSPASDFLNSCTPTAISHLALCFCLIPKSQLIILLKFVQSCSFSVLYPKKKKKKLNKKTGIFSVDELITKLRSFKCVYVYINIYIYI